MNFFALSGLINGITSTILGIFVYTRNRKEWLYRTYVLFCLSVSVWSYFYFAWQVASTEKVALFCTRALMMGAIFIPIFYLHHILELLGITKQKKKLIISGYVFAIISLLFSFSPHFIKSVSQKLYFNYWPNPGIVYHIFLPIWIYFVIYGTVIIINVFRKSYGFKRNQFKYVLLATLCGWIGGTTNYLLWYNIKIPPFGNIFVSMYVLIAAYAIVKYRLMDITVAITRTGIFVAVYTLILGFPFAIAVWFKNWLVGLFGINWWIAPLGLMAALATVGPFIYIFLDRRAEARLFKEQKRYQDTLKQAALGMSRIRDLRKLLHLIVHIVTKTVKISYAAIYLYNPETNEYILNASRDKGKSGIARLNSDNPLIAWINQNRLPLVYEEIKRRMQDFRSTIFNHLEENMRQLSAAVVVPSFLEDKFIGFIVLGDKVSGKIYTSEDLNVFQILASQAALGIENAQFYEEAKNMQAQIAQAEKMATIGTMANGLSHQMNNRLNALSLIAEDTLDTIKTTDISKCSAQIKEFINQINYALERIRANVIQGGEVVKGLLKYSRRGEEGLEPLDLNTILDNTLEMAQYKVKLPEIDIIRNLSKDLPKIKANLTQLQEVFFNFIDNAYDAIVERRELLKEEGYRGKISISAQPEDNILEITIEDNGMGIKEEDKKNLFTPFFTTKVSSRRGTGLGLYVVKRIITDTHRGNISLESEYRVGTKFIVELPIAK